jgi:tripartite-type tricarboxylate transporter receptor subunit TctC
MNSRLRFLAAIAAFFVCASAVAQVPAWPARPVRIIVPTGAGGVTDILARLVGQKLTEAWGQQVLVENRPGAGGTVGTEAVAKAAADGYTLLWVFPAHMVSPALYPKLPYDPIKDFAPITMVTGVNLVLLVNPAVPAGSVKELVALAKSRPGSLNYGAVGEGSLGHLAGAVFKSMAGADIVHVPYKGTPQVSVALLANEVQMFFDVPITAIPPIRSGKLRALAVTSARRLALLPDIPTMQEAGIPGYEVTGWNGVLAPAATPRDIVNKVHADIDRVLKRADVREWMAAQALESVGSRPEEFAAVIQSDMAKWTRIAREIGIKGN